MFPLKPVFPKTLKQQLKITIDLSLEWNLECSVVNINNFSDVLSKVDATILLNHNKLILFLF